MKTNMKAKITTQIIRRYYVEIGGLVTGGPFYTKEEALECLAQTKQLKRNPLLRHGQPASGHNRQDLIGTRI